MRLLTLATAVAFSLPAATALARPIVIGGTPYSPVGPTENLTATFTTPDGGVTTGAYDGLVEVTVSGTGFSEGTLINDAFYLVGPPPSHDPNYYQLTFGTTTLVGLDPAQDAVNSIVYDLDAGTAVTPPYVPAYEADDTYHFVLDTGSVSPVALHFGVSDGDFADNGGAYNISVTQLSAVPEPASVAMFGAGLLGLGLLHRRRKAR